MTHYIYDGSFEGLLTVVFEVFERKAFPASIQQEQFLQPSMFGETVTVTTDEAKAKRVWEGLRQRLSKDGLQVLYYTYLSGQRGFEMLIFDFTRLSFLSKENIEDNFAEVSVLQVQQIKKQVHREKHRMEAFVRFQKTADDLFYAAISPDFNVLPIITSHFEKRYADQCWVIYDLKRHYGVYYDLKSIAVIDLETAPALKKGILARGAFHQEEEKYQQLWQIYFKHVSIPERKNPKLHLRHVPKRYWKYLSEKQPDWLKP